MERNDAKEKPDAAWTASGETTPTTDFGCGSPDNLPDTPPVVQDPDAPDEVRVARLATYYARKQGHRGTYKARHSQQDGEPDVEIWWVEAYAGEPRVERVAFSGRDGTLLVVGDEVHSHRPVVKAGDRIMGDDFSAVGVAS